MIIATDADNVAKLLKVNADRELFVTPSLNTYKFHIWTDDTSGTTRTLWDPAAGKKVHITYMHIYADKACTVNIYDNVWGTTIMLLTFTAQGEKVVQVGGELLLDVDNVLYARLISSGGTTLMRITLFGHEH